MHQKLAIVVLAAGLLFGATGCTPAMSTAETCDKMKTVVLGNLSMFGSGIDKARKTGMIDQLKPMEATESPELRAMVTDTIEYLQESVKDNPDSSKVSELSARANKSASAFTKICR